jgi:hypothetical protein
VVLKLYFDQEKAEETAGCSKGKREEGKSLKKTSYCRLSVISAKREKK